MKKWSLKRKLLTAVGLLILAGAAIVWYLFSLTFDDTATIRPDFTVSADALLSEFNNNDAAANAKYTEKIIEVTGRVSEVEAVDTTVNIKMADSTTGSFIIFAFQAKDAAAARAIKAGETATIRGSCNGGTYSAILDTRSVSFKRSVLTR